MKRNVLGLYLSGKSAQAVVIEQNSSRRTLLALHEWDNTLFDYAGDDTPGTDEFVERMLQFTAAHPVEIHRVRVALDTSLLFMITIPFERAAPRERIEEQIEWELTEYFPGSPPKTFISDLHILARGISKRYDHILSVSVRRDQIRSLHRGLAKLRLGLEIVDPDHFSADTSLHLNHPESADKYLALVGIKDDRIDVSMMRNAELESYTYTTVASRDQAIEYIGNLSRSAEGLQSMMVFGAGLDNGLVSILRQESAIPVEAMNPFRIVHIPTSLRSTTDAAFAPFRYAAAVGVALREE